MQQRKLQTAVAEETGLSPGARMADGTIFAGISPDNGRELFVTAVDVSLTMAFNDAQDHAAALLAHGRRDWRMPTKNELKVIFDNRAAIGGFDEKATYWSITQDTSFSAWCQRFSDGKQARHGVDMSHLLRPVRG